VAGDVEIRVLPAIRVAYLRYTGPYASLAIGDLWGRFSARCVQHGLFPPRRRTYGVAQDNPNITSPGRTRYDACIEVPDGFAPSSELDVQVLPGGRFGCVPFRGTAAEIRGAWVRLLGKTLPEAGYEPDLAPSIEIYEADFGLDPATGTFSCLLCMPLRGA
jgi:AraC family transcriptional regulator